MYVVAQRFSQLLLQDEATALPCNGRTRKAKKLAGGVSFQLCMMHFGDAECSTWNIKRISTQNYLG